MRLTLSFLLLLSLHILQASDQVEIDTLHQRAYRLLDTDPDSAFVLAVGAEAKAVDRELDLEEAKSLFIQAYLYRQKDELGKAFVLYLKALELLRPLEAEQAVLNYVKILLNTGVILDLHYAYPQAIKYYNEGIRVAEQHRMNDRLLKLYYSKAMSLRHNKEFEEALATIRQGLALARKERDEEWTLSALNQRGLIFKDMGLFEEARSNYWQMIDFEFNKSSPEKYKGQAWHNIAVTYMEEENYKEAEIAYLRAVSGNLKRPDSKEAFVTWMDLGETYFLTKNYEKAYEAAQKALAIYDQVLLLPEYYILFDHLSNITYKLGEYNLSRKYSERFVAVNRRFLQAQNEILQVKDQYKMEILTAGFFQEVEAAETEKQYQMILVILVTLFISAFVFEKTRQYYIRRSIKLSLQKIERDSAV